MSRLIAALVLCLFPAGGGAAFAEMAGLKEVEAKIDRLTETPFTGTAEEYPAYATALGDEILGLVEPFMDKPELSDENKKYLTGKKLLGLQLRYGFDDAEYERKYEAFLEAAQDDSLYRTWLSRQFYGGFDSRWHADKTEQTEVFTPLVDRLAPLINKYFDDEKRDSNEQLPSILVGRAKSFDPDGSLGVVCATVEKLRPILEIDAKRPRYDLLRFCAQESLNSTRLFDMVGQQIEFTPNDLDGKPVDMNALKGKVVLIVPAPTQWQWDEEKFVLLEKLYETLKGHGLEIILFFTDNPGIVREQLKSRGESWIITTRYGGGSQEHTDYVEHFGNFDFSIVVDRGGIVTSARADRFSPETCETLKPLFPEQAEQIAEIAEDIRVVDEELMEKSKEYSRKLQTTSDEKLPEPLQKLLDFHGKISLTSPPEMQLVLADLILAGDGLPPDLRLNILREKVGILRDLAQKTVKNNPDMRPETAFAEVVALVDELLETADPVFHHNLVFAKQDALYHMQEHLKTMESGQEEYAEEIARRFVAITKQAPEGFAYNSRFFTMFYLDVLEEIDKERSTQLARSFLKQVVPVFAEKEGLEYKQEGTYLESVLRRLELIDSEMEFETVLLDGSKINVKDLRGKVVVVNFWATTCGPCLREFPHMKTLYEKYKPQGYEMIAYSCGDDEETLRDFVGKHDYPWLFGSQLKSVDAKLTDYNDFYGITGVPTTMILDRSGKVRFMMVGSDDEIFTRELEKRFAEEPGENAE